MTDKTSEHTHKNSQRAIINATKMRVVKQSAHISPLRGHYQHSGLKSGIIY